MLNFGINEWAKLANGILTHLKTKEARMATLIFCILIVKFGPSSLFGANTILFKQIAFYVGTIAAWFVILDIVMFFSNAIKNIVRSHEKDNKKDKFFQMLNTLGEREHSFLALFARNNTTTLDMRNITSQEYITTVPEKLLVLNIVRHHSWFDEAHITGATLELLREFYCEALGAENRI